MSMAQVLKLQSSFTDEQAETLVGFFDEQMATKADLERIRLELKADLDRSKIEIQGGLDRQKLEVERDLKGLEARLVGWLFAQGLAVIGILFALLRFVER